MSNKFIKRLSVAVLATSILSAPVLESVVVQQNVVFAEEKHDHATNAILKWSTGAEIPTIDSAKAYDSVSFNAVSQIGEGLLRLTAEGKIEPAGAAELPTVSEDGLTYTFKLREDAKWSNGEPVTAKDYVYAWQRAVNPDTGSKNAFVLFDLKNGEKINKGEEKVESLGVEAVGDYELKVTLEKAIPNFLYIASVANYFPQNQAFVEQAGEKYGTDSEHVLGNGAFTIEGWNATSLSWSYVKNPNYYNADKVQLEKIEIEVIKDTNTGTSLVEAGELDGTSVSGGLLAEYKGAENLRIFPGSSHNYLEFGISSNPNLQNDDVRKAISYVIDRDVLTQDVLSGGAEKVKALVPQRTVFDLETGEDYVTGQKDYSEFNVEKAQEHWKKAQEALGTQTVELELLVTDNDTAKKIGEYIQGQVQSNLEGFTIKLRPLPAKNRFEEMMSFKFDIALGGWAPSEGDASELLVNFLTNATHNHAQFFNEEYDQLFEQAQSLVGKPAERKEALYKAEQYLLDHQVIVLLIQNSTNLLVSSKVDQLQVLPGVGVDFKSLTIK